MVILEAQVRGHVSNPIEHESIIRRVIVRGATWKLCGACGPVFPAETEVHGQLPGDLPLVLDVQVPDPVTVGREDDSEVPADPVRLVEKESRERVELAACGTAVERRWAGREGEPSTWAERGCLQ